MLVSISDYFVHKKFPSGTWFPLETNFKQVAIAQEEIDISCEYIILVPIMDCWCGNFKLLEFVKSLALGDTMCQNAVLKRDGLYFQMSADAIPGSKLFPAIPKRSAGPCDTLVAVPLGNKQEYIATLDRSRWRDILSESSQFYLLGRFDDVFDWVRFERASG